MFNFTLCITSSQIYLLSRSQRRLPPSALFGLPSAPCEVRPGISNPGVRVLGNKGSEANDCKLRLRGRPALPGCSAGHVRGSSGLHTVRTEPGGAEAWPRRGRGRSAWPAIELPGRDGGSAAAGPGVAPRKPLLEPRAPRPSAGAGRGVTCGRWAGRPFPSAPAPPASRAAEPGSGRGSERGGDCGGCSPAGLRASGGLHGAAGAALRAVGAAALRRPRRRGCARG